MEIDNLEATEVKHKHLSACLFCRLVHLHIFET